MIQPTAALLTSLRAPTLWAYEDAATAIGRLDAAAGLAPRGLARLLAIRTSARAVGASRDGMIAVLRPDGEGAPAVRGFHDALLAGTARARGGGVPTVQLLYELLALAPPADAAFEDVDALLRDAAERTPPVLKAVVAALALDAAIPDRESGARIAALAVTLVLCVGGAITDASLTLPLAREAVSDRGAPDAASEMDARLLAEFGALAREARAAERGLRACRARLETDSARVREALGRASYSALDMLALLGAELVITVPAAARALGQTAPTAGAAVARLEDLGIAREITGRTRSRAFVYGALVDAMGPK